MIKRFLLRLFLAIFPKRYLPLLIDRLTEGAYQRFDFPGYEIYLNQGRAVTVSWGAKEDWIEPELVDWIDTHLKPGQVLYDVGANVGIYSLIAAKRHQGKVKVYAFEPAAPTVPILIRNIMYNGCSETIVPLTFPLSRKTALAPYNYFHMLMPGQVGHAFGDAIDYHGDAFKPLFQEFMLSTSIDELVNEFRIPAPQHIKIDVDGLDAEILAGAEKVLRSGVVESVFFEVSSRFPFAETSKFLIGCGFVPTATFQHDNTSNAIFIKKK